MIINLGKSTAAFRLGQIFVNSTGISQKFYNGDGFWLKIWRANKTLKLRTPATKAEVALYMRVKGIYEITTSL